MNFNNALISSLESMAPVMVKRVKRTSQPPWFGEHICKSTLQVKGQTRDYKYWRKKSLFTYSFEKVK